MYIHYITYVYPLYYKCGSEAPPDTNNLSFRLINDDVISDTYH